MQDLSFADEFDVEEDTGDKNQRFADSKYPGAKNLRSLWIMKFVDQWRHYRALYFPSHDADNTEPFEKKTMGQRYGFRLKQKQARFVGGKEVPEEILTFFNLQTLGPDDNPLVWWKNNESTFPVLSRMARDILAIPASSSEPERVFSLARNVMQYNQQGMVPSSIQAHVRVRSLLRFKGAAPERDPLDREIDYTELYDEWVAGEASG